MSKLDDLLKSINLEKITENSGEGTFERLPDGFYLAEVEKMEFTVAKSSGKDQMVTVFKVVQDGVNFEGHNLEKVSIPNTINRRIYKYYQFDTEAKVTRMIGDLLKFKEDNEPIFESNYFSSKDAIEEGFVLLLGKYIWVELQTKGEFQSVRLLTWEGAEEINLID